VTGRRRARQGSKTLLDTDEQGGIIAAFEPARGGGFLAYCPECDAEIEGEPFEFEEGEVIECPECGSELEVSSTSPLEFEVVESDWEADEEEWD
jgi:lysine biosynthesis protein LysW